MDSGLMRLSISRRICPSRITSRMGPDGLCSADVVVSHASGIGEMLEDLKKHTFALHDSFTVGEVFNGKEEELREFIGPDGHFSSIFDFSQHLLCLGKHGWYEAKPVDFKTWRSTLLLPRRRWNPSEGIPILLKIMMSREVPACSCRIMAE